MKKFIFRDTETDAELILPVTPDSFEVSHGVRIETVNIHTLGDVNLKGYGSLASVKISCMFPAKDYPFNQPSAGADPYQYVGRIRALCEAGTVLRFVVSETNVNVPVLIEELSYGEKDGTGDVYAALALREYRELTAVQKGETGNETRTSGSANVTAQKVKINPGDTLWSICRKYYDDTSLYQKLADYNGIKNPNLIIAGNYIGIPSKNLLQGG